MLVLKHLARIVWPVMTASKRAASTGAKPSPKKLKSDAALTHELLEHPTIKTIQSWNMKKTASRRGFVARVLLCISRQLQLWKISQAIEKSNASCQGIFRPACTKVGKSNEK